MNTITNEALKEKLSSSRFKTFVICAVERCVSLSSDILSLLSTAKQQTANGHILWGENYAASVSETHTHTFQNHRLMARTTV